MWIEFVGGVGTGKSSLATALKERFRAADIAVNSPQEALERRLARSLPRAICEGRPGQAARWALLAGYQARFSLNRPKLVWQSWNASRRLRHLPGWHRRIIFSLFFEVAGWYDGLAYGLAPKPMVVVDEGLAHRSINLFAWQTGALDTRAIRAYFENLPEVPLTISVYAPVNVSLDRAYNRGLPRRLRGKDPRTIRRFIENSHSIASLAEEILIAHGRSVIKIDNTFGLEQSTAILCRQVAETALFREYFPKRSPAAFVNS